MTRRQQLMALAAQLHELTTAEERRDYPFFDHLEDLIDDLGIEEEVRAAIREAAARLREKGE